MSRVGKQPVPIPAGVEVSLEGQKVSVKGPLGALSQEFRPEVRIAREGDTIQVSVASEDRRVRAIHGLTRALINNMVRGVSEGFKKTLELHGIGYRAAVEGSTLVLNLGHSHPIRHPIPEGIKIGIEVSKDKITSLRIQGSDKREVGQVAADVRAYRPVEPYRGKGLRYSGERVRRKVGKAGA